MPTGMALVLVTMCFTMLFFSLHCLLLTLWASRHGLLSMSMSLSNTIRPKLAMAASLRMCAMLAMLVSLVVISLLLLYNRTSNNNGSNTTFSTGVVHATLPAGSLSSLHDGVVSCDEERMSTWFTATVRSVCERTIAHDHNNAGNHNDLSNAVAMLRGLALAHTYNDNKSDPRKQEELTAEDPMHERLLTETETASTPAPNPTTQSKLGPKRNLHETWLTRCGTSWQEAYSNLHADILAGRREPKFLVYSCNKAETNLVDHCAGLGNRLQAIAGLLWLSVLTSRALLIDWAHPEPLTHYLQSNGIQWDFNLNSPTILALPRKYVQWGWRNHTDVLWRFLESGDVAGLLNHPVVVVRAAYDIFEKGLEVNSLWTQRDKGAIPDEVLSNSVGCAFHFLFKMNPSTISAVDEHRAKGPLMAAHIRVGGTYGVQLITNTTYTHTGADTTSTRTRLEVFLDCVTRVRRDLAAAPDGNPSDTVIFLAADMDVIRHRVLATLSPANIVWLRRDAKSARHIDDSHGGPGTMRAAFMDLVLLAEAPVVLSLSSYYTPSSFSGVAGDIAFKEAGRCRATFPNCFADDKGQQWSACPISVQWPQ
eukprot:jgi/Chlat1/9203/Chrsp97S08409